VQIVTKERYSHLVSIVKGESCLNNSFFLITFMVPVPEAEDGENSPWFVFNDFVVRNISEEEALSFPDVWKVCSVSRSFAIISKLKFGKLPAIVYLERVDMRENLDFSGLPDGLDPSILSRDTSISL
jgi:PAB-dependent poly(A)-specific ribonuclease subunit 2